MHIILDGIPLKELRTGVGHYTAELARALAQKFPEHTFELISPYPFHPDNQHALCDHGSANLALTWCDPGLLGRQWFLFGARRVLRQKTDVLFHGTNFEIPFRNARPAVLTIHDLSVLLYPETHFARRVRRTRVRLPIMAKRADMIITPTESVRREVCGRLKVPEDKVVAIPEAARNVFRPVEPDIARETRRRLGIGERFLLCVGTLEPRKNLEVVVRAFSRIVSSQNTDLELVIAGQKGWLTSGIDKEIGRPSVRERIKLTGYISDDDLAALYSSCAAFIYASIYEGFGLPPLEAMSCGAPVIASRIAALSEVLGNKALFFEPDNDEELADKIMQLVSQPAIGREMGRDGIIWSARYSWERTALETMNVYLEAARRFRRIA